MATNLGLDDKLIREAVRAGKHRTKKEAVNAALREYIKMRRRAGILELAGTIDFWPDFNHRALRRRKSA